MRNLSVQDLRMVNGGNGEPDEPLFDSFVFGIAAGTIIGATVSIHYVCKYPLIAVIPGVLENAVKVGAIGGACMGGIIGAFTGIIIANT
jgi:hypothetical protein